LAGWEGFIFHFSFVIFHLPFVAHCFVSVRVISWIVLYLSDKQAIHELTRITTNCDQKMTNEK